MSEGSSGNAELGTCYNQSIPVRRLGRYISEWHCQRPATHVTAGGDPLCDECREEARKRNRDRAHLGFGVHASYCPRDCQRECTSDRVQWYNTELGWMLEDALKNGHYPGYNPAYDCDRPEGV